MEKNGEIILYEWANWELNIEVRLEWETVRLSQDQMAQLFWKSRSTINEHIKNIYEEWELLETDTLHKFGISEFQQKATNYYNLDMIISVWYRVKSKQWIQFRQWATARLKEYIIKWFTLDDERLKWNWGGNYWKELLNRIRDIRSSEKALYRQVLDLYATSIDYDPKSPISIQFFKIVQNKLHYATNQHTAAETIYERADSNKDFMGLTTFAWVMPTLSDVKIAKNYLTKDELFRLNRMVSAFFDLAEIKAQEHEKMTMQDWVDELDKFTQTYWKWVLPDGWKISHKEATEKAEKEYRNYQAKTLSPVEIEYLNSIKDIEKKVKKNLLPETTGGGWSWNVLVEFGGKIHDFNGNVSYSFKCLDDPWKIDIIIWNLNFIKRGIRHLISY